MPTLRLMMIRACALCASAGALPARGHHGTPARGQEAPLARQGWSARRSRELAYLPDISRRRHNSNRPDIELHYAIEHFATKTSIQQLIAVPNGPKCRAAKVAAAGTARLVYRRAKHAAAGRGRLLTITSATHGRIRGQPHRASARH